MSLFRKIAYRLRRLFEPTPKDPVDMSPPNTYDLPDELYQSLVTFSNRWRGTVTPAQSHRGWLQTIGDNTQLRQLYEANRNKTIDCLIALDKRWKR